VPAEPISQLAACGAVRVRPSAVVSPYSTVECPATFVDHWIVIAEGRAWGFSTSANEPGVSFG